MNKNNKRKERKTDDFPTKYVATLLFVLGIGHILAPAQLTLDWQSIFILTLAIVIASAHQLVWLLPFIKSVKLGEAAIELRDNIQQSLEKLKEDVSEAEQERPLQEPAIPDATKRVKFRTYDAAVNLPSQSKVLDANKVYAILDKTYDLAKDSRELAFFFLVKELEDAVLWLYLLTNSYRTIIKPFPLMVDELLLSGVLHLSLARGLKEIWEIKQALTPPVIYRAVFEKELAAAIASGLKLIRFLQTVFDEQVKVKTDGEDNT